MSVPYPPTLLAYDAQTLAYISAEAVEFIWRHPEFPLEQIPDSSLQNLCYNLIHRAGMTGPEMVLMLRFIRRLKKRIIPNSGTIQNDGITLPWSIPPTFLVEGTDSIPITVWNQTNAVVGAILMANKIVCDNVLSSKSWGKVLGMDPKELTKLEFLFAQALEWKLHITVDEYWRWVEHFEKLSTEGFLSEMVGRIREFASRGVVAEPDHLKQPPEPLQSSILQYEPQELQSPWAAISPWPLPNPTPPQLYYSMYYDSNAAQPSEPLRRPSLHLQIPRQISNSNYTYATTPTPTSSSSTRRTSSTPISAILPPAPMLGYANIPGGICTCDACVANALSFTIAPSFPDSVPMDLGMDVGNMDTENMSSGIDLSMGMGMDMSHGSWWGLEQLGMMPVQQM